MRGVNSKPALGGQFYTVCDTIGPREISDKVTARGFYTVQSPG
jgi:hypothetical protein